MTPKTIEGLRTMLEERAADVEIPPALAARTTSLARGVRTRRRLAAGGVTVLALAAAVVPIVIGWPDSGVRPEPADTVTPAPDGGAVWTPDLPGLDLPEGEPLTGAYAIEGTLVINGSEIALDEAFGPFTTVPGGVVVESGYAPESTSSQASRLDLVRAGGDVEAIDSGVIAGSAAARQGDGSVLLAYGWLESPTAATSEIRVVEIGSDQPPEVIPVEPAATVLGLAGRSVLIGYSAFDPGGDQAWLDLDTGEAALVGEGVYSEGVTAGGLEVTWDENSSCLTGSSTDGVEAWQRCDLMSSFGLSPDGRWIVTRTGDTIDAETGADATSFGLPSDLADGALHVRLVGWDDVDHPVFTLVEYEDRGDGSGERVGARYVAVRCSVSTAECERIPHPVDILGKVVG